MFTEVFNNIGCLMIGTFGAMTGLFLLGIGGYRAVCFVQKIITNDKKK